MFQKLPIHGLKKFDDFTPENINKVVKRNYILEIGVEYRKELP